MDDVLYDARNSFDSIIGGLLRVQVLYQVLYNYSSTGRLPGINNILRTSLSSRRVTVSFLVLFFIQSSFNENDTFICWRRHPFGQEIVADLPRVPPMKKVIFSLYFTGNYIRNVFHYRELKLNSAQDRNCVAMK